MQEEKTRFEIDNRLAIHTESEMTRLNDPCMNGADSYLVDPFTLHLLEWERPAIVFEDRRRFGVSQQWMIVGRRNSDTHVVVAGIGIEAHPHPTEFSHRRNDAFTILSTHRETPTVFNT